MLKNQIIIQKGLNILRKSPIILLYHYNSVSTKKWQFLKSKINKTKDINILVIQNKIATKVLNNIQLNKEITSLIDNPIKKDFIVKPKRLNPLGVTSLEVKPLFLNSSSVVGKTKPSYKSLNSLLTDKNNTKNQLHNLFQGPTFVLGCNTNEQLVFIYDLLKTSSNFVFIGGLYNNQNISHKFLNKLVKLNHSVNLDFIRLLEFKSQSVFLLKNCLISNFFNLLQRIQVPLKKI